MPVTLKVGDHFEFHNSTYFILDLGPGTLMAERNNDKVVVDLNVNSLLKDNSFHLLDRDGKHVTPKLDYDTFDEEVKEEANEQFQIIEPLVLYYENSVILESKYKELLNDIGMDNMNLTNLVKGQVKALRDKGVLVSERKVWRFWKKWREHGIKGLKIRRGEGVMQQNKMIKIKDPKSDEVLQEIQCRLSEDQIKIVEDVIKNYFFKTIKPLKSMVLERIRMEFEKKGLPLVNDSTIYRILKSIDERYVVLFREGKKEYNKKFKSVSPRNNEATKPLGVVQIDHNRLDIIVRDDETGFTGRPWLTLGLDEYSRQPWCLEIGFEHPSAETVSRSILQGVLPKNFNETYGTRNELECFGIPGVIYVDNAKEFHSKQLERVVKEVMKGELRFRPPGQPQYSAHVERVFGTLNTELIHNIEGTTKSNPSQLGDRKPVKDCCLSLSDLKKIIIKYFVDYYQFSDHRGLPKDCPIPYARFQEGIENYGLPRVFSVSEKDQLWRQFLPEVRRDIVREGIQVNNIRYASEETKVLIGNKKQKVKIDPYDASYIYLFHPKQKSWVRVNAVKPSVAALEGVTQYQWTYIQKRLKEKGVQVKSRIPQTKQILEIREELNNIVQEAKRTTRKINRNMARLKNETKENSKEDIVKKDAESLLDDLYVPPEDIVGEDEFEFKEYTSEDDVSVETPEEFKEW